MAKYTTRSELLSLDTINLIKKLYPKAMDFYRAHLQNTEVTPISFYAAMRHENIDAHTEILIESSLQHDLMKRGIDRDTLALVSTVPAFLEHLETLLLEADRIKDNKYLITLDTETRSQLLQTIKFFVSQECTEEHHE